MQYFIGADGKHDFVNSGNCIPVIVDVLRASSTIIAALWAGAERVIPVVDAEEALAIGKSHDAILIGERHGLRIDGFDHNNSPVEMLTADIKGRVVVITTSNGTKIMAEGGLIGSTLNASAVAAAIANESHAYLLATGPEKSVEDLCAARIIENIANDTADDQMVVPDLKFATLRDQIRNSADGKYLTEKGFGKDVDLICTAINRFPILPVYKNGAITIKK